MKILQDTEITLVGSWVQKNGQVIADDTCARIQWLIDNLLLEISVDEETWSVLYKDPKTNSYWELSYPCSHMHGGGPPLLQRMSESDASKKYG